MSDEPFNFAAEADEVFRRAIREFTAWAAQNWTMTAAEAETLKNPTDAPKAYARGYCEALESLPDAADLWLDGEL